MSNNQSSNFASHINTFITLVSAAATVYEVGSTFYQNRYGLNSHSNENSSDNKKCVLCQRVIESSFFNRFINNFFTCSICRNNYHKDCHLAKTHDLNNTKRCPKCKSISLS